MTVSPCMFICLRKNDRLQVLKLLLVIFTSSLSTRSDTCKQYSVPFSVDNCLGTPYNCFGFIYHETSSNVSLCRSTNVLLMCSIGPCNIREVAHIMHCVYRSKFTDGSKEVQIINAIIQSLLPIVKRFAFLFFSGEQKCLLPVLTMPTLYITYICIFVDLFFIFWQTKIKKDTFISFGAEPFFSIH
jgi:hypothetical protein